MSDQTTINDGCTDVHLIFTQAAEAAWVTGTYWYNHMKSARQDNWPQQWSWSLDDYWATLPTIPSLWFHIFFSFFTACRRIPIWCFFWWVVTTILVEIHVQLFPGLARRQGLGKWSAGWGATCHLRVGVDIWVWLWSKTSRFSSHKLQTSQRICR